MIGSSAATIGSSRMPESDTATAASNPGAPEPSVETTITCAGPAQTSTVESQAHIRLKPRSWHSAP